MRSKFQFKRSWQKEILKTCHFLIETRTETSIRYAEENDGEKREIRRERKIE